MSDGRDMFRVFFYVYFYLQEDFYAKNKISKYRLHTHDGILHGLLHDLLHHLHEHGRSASAGLCPGYSGNVAGIRRCLLPDFLCHYKICTKTGIPHHNTRN